MSKSSLEAAAEAAAKVNAMLIAKGKLKPSVSLNKSKISGGQLRNITEDLITAEVDINDAPQSARNMLTRGHSQDEICKFSAASISTRGRYMTLEEKQNISTADCRPLYLHVQASSMESINVAVSRIQDIINQHIAATGGVKGPTVGVVTYCAKTTNGIPVLPNSLTSGSHFVQDKVFVGLEHSPPTYPVREKILGPNASFLQHIRTETGANVILRGRGSGFIEPTSGREAFEPLYIHITHPKVEGLQAAKALAINLVDTAHIEFFEWQKQQTVLPYQNQGVSSQTVIAYPAAYVTNPGATLTQTAPSSASIVGVVSLPVSLASPETSLISTQPLSPLTQFHSPVQTVTLTQPIAYANVPSSLPANIVSESHAPESACFTTISRDYMSRDSHLHKPQSLLPITVVETAYPHVHYTSSHLNKPYGVNRGCIRRTPESLQKPINSNHPTETGVQPGAGSNNAVSPCMDRDLMPPPPLFSNHKKITPPKRSIFNGDPVEIQQSEPDVKKLRGALVGLASVYGSDDSSDDES